MPLPRVNLAIDVLTVTMEQTRRVISPDTSAAIRGNDPLIVPSHGMRAGVFVENISPLSSPCACWDAALSYPILASFKDVTTSLISRVILPRTSAPIRDKNHLFVCAVTRCDRALRTLCIKNYTIITDQDSYIVTWTRKNDPTNFTRRVRLLRHHRCQRHLPHLLPLLSTCPSLLPHYSLAHAP